MASAAFTVDSNPNPDAHAVAVATTVDLALVSTDGVRSVEWSVVGRSHAALSAPTITAAGTPSGVTASFTSPSESNRAIRVRCRINGGFDDAGQTVAAYTQYAVIGVVNAGGYVPFVSLEEFDRDGDVGWTEDLNDALEAAITGVTAGIVTDSNSGRTLALTDAGKYVRMTNATPTVTVPPNADVAFPIGTLVTGITTAGAGTIAEGSGVTVNKPASRSLGTYEAGSSFALKKVDTNEWDLTGDLAVT